MPEPLSEENLLLLAESYRDYNPEYAAYLAAEAVIIRHMRARQSIRCERCTWAWHPVGEFPWRCERCSAVAVKL